MPSDVLSRSNSKTPADGLRRGAPSAFGVDARTVGAFLDDVERAGLELHGFMLWRSGAVVAEGWHWPYRADRLRMMHSVTKSITGCAIGFLVEEGRLSLDARVADFFPTEAAAADPRTRFLTVEHLLSMRTGHAVEVSGALWRGIESSWVAEFFRIPVEHDPGTVHVYSSAASYMLSAIVTRVTGKTIHDYLRPRLFQPLGITSERWDIGPDGFNPGGNGIDLTLPDALKFGILHAQRGVWAGQQILPAEWIDAATQPQGSERYGHHWVVGDGYYAALGVFVQMVAIWPEQGVVLAITGAMEDSSVLLPHLRRHFPGAFRSNCDPASDETLRRRLEAWSQPPKVTPSASAREIEIDRSTWIVDQNDLGISRLSFETTGATVTLMLHDRRGSHDITAAFEGWRETTTDMPGSTLHHGYCISGPVVAGARWLSDTTLEMTWHFVETAFRDTVVVDFEDDELVLNRSVNINSGNRAWPTLVARRVR